MTHRLNKRSPANRQSQMLGLGLDISKIVLTTLTDAARLAPIPYLQESAVLALGIFNTIQGVRTNKIAFTRLAHDACALVYAILCTGLINGGRTPSGAYLDHLRELVATLAEIESFTSKEASRTRIIRIIKHKADIDTIKEYRAKLRRYLDVFRLKSNISIHENLHRIEGMMLEMRASKQEELRQEKLAIEEAEKKAAERVEWEAWEKARMEKEEQDRRHVEERRRRWETERLEAEQIAAATREGQQRVWEQSSYGTPVSSNPFHQYQNRFSTPLQAMNGHHTSIGGNQNTYTASVINTNSGNTTTSTVSNSNNDSSVRISRDPVGRGRPSVAHGFDTAANPDHQSPNMNFLPFTPTSVNASIPCPGVQDGMTQRGHELTNQSRPPMNITPHSQHLTRDVRTHRLPSSSYLPVMFLSPQDALALVQAWADVSLPDYYTPFSET